MRSLKTYGDIVQAPQGHTSSWSRSRGVKRYVSTLTRDNSEYVAIIIGQNTCIKYLVQNMNGYPMWNDLGPAFVI